MNDYFIKILTARIKKALTDAQNSHDIAHPYLIGKLKEIVLRELIAPMLNERYSIGSGKVIDYKGSQSKEVDLCIYSKTVHPPMFFSPKNDIGVFPIESVLGCVEVKSGLKKRDLEEAFENFKHLEDNLVMTTGFHNERDVPLSHVIAKHENSVFAFNIEKARYTPDSMLNLYSKIDPNWNSDPLISSICLANNGWICYTTRGWLHIPFNRGTKVNEEIIGFLCSLIQGLPKVEGNRGTPRIGYYLTDPSKAGQFKNGRLVKKSFQQEGIYVFSNDKVVLNKGQT